ncbi:MAG TPA: RidA family protein [Terriglobales bacterium]|nr:RidA family protein [Terriglobales bacterium]
MNPRIYRFAALALLGTTTAAQTAKPSASNSAKKDAANAGVRYINPPGLAANPRFSQMAEITGGRMILISGQVAYDKSGSVVGKGDIRAQSTQVFENLKIALDAVGASFNDVVKLNTFLVDMSANISGYREVRERYLAKNDHPPASTTVGVSALVNPDLLLEVEAVVVPK